MTKNVSFSILIFVVFSIQSFAQFETIQEFPKEYPTQDIRELTPVWVSENEILVFYTNSTLDTIFSRRTINSGLIWSQQKVEQTNFETQQYELKLFITACVGHNNRILLSWSGKIVYSDDNGLTWSESTLPVPSFLNKFSKLQKLSNNRIQFSCYEVGRWLYISTNNGETWSNENRISIPRNPIGTGASRDFGVAVLNEDSILVVSGTSNIFHSNVYSFVSSDFGNTWSEPTVINEIKIVIYADRYYGWIYGPRICLEADANKNIYLFCDQSYDTGYDSIRQHDVEVLKSSDFGDTWQQEEKFTKYLGHDFLDNTNVFNDKFLVSFYAARSLQNINYPFVKQNYFGVYGLSEDTFTPPVLLSFETAGVDYENEEVNYRAKVIDDEGVSKVVAQLNQINSSIELFDDGLHNDSLANDNIYGNVIPIINDGKAGESYAIDLNNITLPFNRSGIIADVNIGYKGFTFELEMIDISGSTSSTETRADIPIRGGPGSVGKFDEGGFLFSGGFFLSGYSNGQMWSNAVASASLVEDYLPGKVGSEVSSPLNSIYVVNKRDPAFSLSWRNWKDAVTLGAEFYDGDGDGIYNPVDKNWNGTWDLNEDMPLLIGDEIAWCVYNDGLPKNVRRWNTVDPQGIEVRQTIFASDNSELENVIFIRYSILNTGTVAEVMDSVYFGIWEDGDLGDATDDVVGCDTLLNSGFYYGNEPDAQYGENPPAFFSTLLQGPILNTNNPSDTARINFGNLLGIETISNSKNLDITSHIFFTGGTPDLRDPNTAIEARNYILGGDRQGDFPNPCTWAFGQVRGGVDCHQVNPRLWFSGDPVENIGWICDQNRDSRNLVSTGPFELEKDKPQEIIIAYVIGRGNDPINSVTVARENVQRAIQEYESNFASMTYTPPPATNPVNSYVLYQNYPNPFNPITTIRYELPQDGVVTIEVFDILGQKVRAILNEFKKADRYEVTFNSSGLASGVYIYQLRVNDFITSKKMVLIK